MRLLTFLTLLSLVAGCQAPPEGMNPEAIAQIESVIRAQGEALVTTQNSLDADGFLAYFSREGLDWVNVGTHYTSYEAVDRWIRNLLGSLDSFDSGWNELGVTVLSDKAALSHGNWWGRQVVGNQVTTGNALYWTALHELEEDGSWRITRVHQSWSNLVTEETD
jgi:hypothetical protein